MRRTWKKLLLGIVVGTFAVYFIALMVTTKRTPTFPPLPDPNGYDDFLKAAALLNALQVDTMYTNDPIALHEFMSAAAEPLRLVQLGLSRTCSVPTMEVMTNFSNRINELAQMKMLAQFLANEGRLAELEGRTNDALRCYVDGISFGNEVGRGGFMIHRLVGVACEAIADAGLTRIMPTLNREQSRPLIKTLGEIDRDAVTWNHVSKNEATFARFEMKKSINPVTWVMGWWQAREAIRKAHERHDQITARRRLFILELALRCYLAETGKPPARLNDLIPKYLSQVPEDPFTGQPLVYRPQNTNWMVYSVGPDRIDDGGTPTTRAPLGTAKTKKGDLFYYSP
jgi:hypothetical protein